MALNIYGRKIDWLLLIVCVVTVALLATVFVRQGVNPLAAVVSTFNALELSLLDKRSLIRAKTLTPSPDVVILALDRQTQAYARQHADIGLVGSALRRDRLAQLIRYLKQEGARAVVLDIQLSTPTPYDHELAKAMKDAGNVYAAFSMDTPMSEREITGLGEDATPELMREHREAYCLKYAYTHEYQHDPAYLAALEKSRVNVDASAILDDDLIKRSSFCYSEPIAPEIAEALKALATSSVIYDSDAMVRQMPVLRRGYNKNFYTYIGIKPALDLLNIDKVRYTPDAFSLFRGEKLVKNIPLTDGWRMIINWRDPANLARSIQKEASLTQDVSAHLKMGRHNTILGNGTLYRHVSVSDVLKVIDSPTQADDLGTLYVIPQQSETGRFSFKGKVVVYGDTSRDIHETPPGKRTYGPEILAAVLDSVLNDQVFVKKASMLLTMVITLALSLLIVFCMVQAEKFVVAFVEGLCFIVFFWVATFVAFYVNALWIPMVFPTLFLLFVLMGAILYRYYIHDREKRYLTSAFSRYVSPQLMAQVLRDPVRALENLKGEKKLMTVMFTDIREFTRRLEEGQPDVIMSQLNRYFDVMIQIILSYEGTYDKFLGDGLLVFFGAPVDVPEHAQKACRAALAMEKALVRLNEEFIAEGLEPLEHSVGIATGEMIVGNFGSSMIKNFTVMGSVVNLAARLETYTRQTEEKILVSEETHQFIKDWKNTHAIGSVPIKGFSGLVKIYGLRA